MAAQASDRVIDVVDCEHVPTELGGVFCDSAPTAFLSPVRESRTGFALCCAAPYDRVRRRLVPRRRGARYMMVRARVAAAACLLAGCVVSPESHTLVDGGAPVTFTGSTISLAGLPPLFVPLRIYVDYQDASGTWILLGSALAGSNGTWSVGVTPPEAAFWGQPCGLATFRVRDSFGATYTGVDAACLATTPGSSCSTTTIVLQRRETVAGNLTINGQAQAAKFQCLNRVQGDLSIVGGRADGDLPGFFAPGVSFTLPQLREVTGGLAIDGDRTEQLSLPLLTSVGGDLNVTLNSFETLLSGAHTFTVNTLDAPLLASVGGSVGLQTARFTTSGGASTTFAFGLPALTTVGADVVMHNPVFPGYVTGLPAVTTIPGNLVYDWGMTDMVIATLLPSLAAVSGDAHLTLPPNARVALGALQTIGGTLTIDSSQSQARLDPPVLPLLTTVSGDLVLQNAAFACSTSATRWPSLATVAGTLRIEGNSTFGQNIGATGTTHLGLGGLEMSGTTSARIPLFSDASVAVGGALSFVNNANLCSCQISAFVSTVTAGGWSGPLTDTGNGTAAACSPCPVPSSCP